MEEENKMEKDLEKENEVFGKIIELFEKYEMRGNESVTILGHLIIAYLKEMKVSKEKALSALTQIVKHLYSEKDAQ